MPHDEALRTTEGPAGGLPQLTLRDPRYLRLLALCVLLTFPAALITVGFIKAYTELIHLVWTTLPDQIGVSDKAWLALVIAPLAGALIGLVIRYAPGQRIMVDVRINGAASARLVLDTGADRTIINPRALRSAGVLLTKPVATGQIVGVTGTDRLPFVIVDSLDVGDVRLVQMPVGVYEIAEADDGLLGRDFLDRFHVTIDAARGLVTLSPK